MMLRRIGPRLAALFGVALMLTACSEGGLSLYSAPLPGGADIGDNPYRITVQFRDVLDLVPQAAVKVNDVPVGRVERIHLAEDTKSAYVDLVVHGDVDLPANSYAELRQSSLLGEKFVELGAPPDGEEQGRLGDETLIPLDRTNRNPQVEEVLGALSLLLNGGGVEQVRVIVRELNETLTGNEPELRALLSRVDELATVLDSQKGEIVRALDALDRLSGTLVEQTDNLTTALDHLGPGLQVVADQRDQLVGMLKSLDELSETGVRVVNTSRDQVVENLQTLTPVLEKLVEAGHDLPEALKILPTYPLPSIAGRIVRGDYANVHARIDIQLDSILRNILSAEHPAIQKDVFDTHPKFEDQEPAAAAVDDAGGEEDLPLPLPPASLSPDSEQRGQHGGPGGVLGGLLGGE